MYHGLVKAEVLDLSGSVVKWVEIKQVKQRFFRSGKESVPMWRKRLYNVAKHKILLWGLVAVFTEAVFETGCL